MQVSRGVRDLRLAAYYRRSELICAGAQRRASIADAGWPRPPRAPACTDAMLGTDNTLRSGHLLLLLLVTSLIILGFGYLNEMYQRIHLQTQLTIVERHTQHAASERLLMEHKAGQLQMKLEAAYQERKRIADMHDFQSQQQNSKFENEKTDLLEDISLKEKEIAKLKDQYESLKLRFGNLHSVVEQFEKNQSRLLEKFAVQATQCTNVINMMGELCSKSKNKIQQILPFIREKKTLMTALTKQPSTVIKKHENQSAVPSQEGGIAKTQMPLMQATTDIPFLSSGGKQSHIGRKVNDPSLEPESQGNDQYNTLAPKIKAQGSYLNVTTEEKMANAAEQALLTLQNKGNLNEKITRNYINERTKEKGILNLFKSNLNQFENVSSTEHASKNEDIELKKSSQLTNSNDLTNRTIINITQDHEERKPNFQLSEDRKPETTIGKITTKESTKVNLEDKLNSLFNVYNTEETDKEGIVEEDEEKYEEIHLTDNDKESHENVLQTVGIEHIE